MRKVKTLRGGLFALSALCVALLAGCEGGGGSEGGSGPGGTGVAGSTARMVIVDDYLYAIAEDQIQLFDISTPSSPNPWNRVTVNWDIQTLFPYENYLLVGAASGLYILDNTDRASPFPISEFRHATALDPVVATQGYAYVTLKTDPNSPQTGRIDQLSVVDLADIYDPRLAREIPMQAPEGLSTVDSRLFICDGVAGLKQYNLSNPENPSFVDVLPDVDCNDVIAYNGILYVITDNSLEQYDYSVSPPARLSVLDTDTVSADAFVGMISNSSSL